VRSEEAEPQDEDRPATALVVMGVSGSGKSTVGKLLAERLGWDFAEADDFHPEANVAKMSAGVALTDSDRWPWLRAIAAWMSERSAAGVDVVVTCSALRRVYRDVLREAGSVVRFVHVAGDRELIAERMASRSGHFMPATLLASQLATLEPLEDDEDGVVVDLALPPAQIVDQALQRLGLTHRV
jgi:gluconokinase